jgi:hypothetical protein
MIPEAQVDYFVRAEDLSRRLDHQAEVGELPVQLTPKIDLKREPLPRTAVLVVPGEDRR